MSYQKLARTYADAFETATRDDGTPFVRLKSDAPDWIDMHAVHCAVDGPDPRLPDDWIYSKASSVADTLTEYADVDADTLHEIADGLVDIASYDLVCWLQHGSNRALVDEVAADIGAPDPFSLDGMIQRAQYGACYRIAAEIDFQIQVQIVDGCVYCGKPLGIDDEACDACNEEQVDEEMRSD